MIYAKHEFTTNLGAKMYTIHDTSHKRAGMPKEYEQHVGYVVIHLNSERKYLDTVADPIPTDSERDEYARTIEEWDEAVNVHEIAYTDGIETIGTDETNPAPRESYYSEHYETEDYFAYDPDIDEPPSIDHMGL